MLAPKLWQVVIQFPSRLPTHIGMRHLPACVSCQGIRAFYRAQQPLVQFHLVERTAKLVPLVFCKVFILVEQSVFLADDSHAVSVTAATRSENLKVQTAALREVGSSRGSLCARRCKFW